MELDAVDDTELLRVKVEDPVRFVDIEDCVEFDETRSTCPVLSHLLRIVSNFFEGDIGCVSFGSGEADRVSTCGRGYLFETSVRLRSAVCCQVDG